MLSRLFAPAVTDERVMTTSNWNTWPGDSSPRTGGPITQTTAMQLLAVHGCVSYISDQVATLPIDVYRQDSSGGRTQVPTPAWLNRPTVALSWIDWCSQLLVSMLLHGNFFAAISRNSQGDIVEILPVDPTVITVARHSGRKVYLVGGVPYTGELLHICGKMFPGTDVGMSPLECARKSISLGIEAIDYGADNFQSSLNMPGVIQLPGKAQPEVMREMGLSWRKQRQGKRNRGLPGVLESGATWTATGVTNEQAQFLETRQWTAAEIAGQVFLIDPAELGIPVVGTSLTYGNIEQRSIASFRRGFQPLVVRIEHAMSALLPVADFMKINVAGLLRADSTARWDVYGKQMAINKIAAEVGQPPVTTTTEMRDFEDFGALDDTQYEVVQPVAVAAVRSDTDVELLRLQTNSAAPLSLHVAVDARQETPTINVTTPEMRTDVHVPQALAPVVNITNEAAEPSEVRVVVERQGPTTRTVERDTAGNITRIVEE